MVATESITENPEDLIVILIDSDLVHLTPQTKDGVLYLTNGISGGWYGINNAKMKVLVDARDAAYAAAAQAP
jgi:hypothetical protein